MPGMDLHTGGLQKEAKDDDSDVTTTLLQVPQNGTPVIKETSSASLKKRKKKRKSDSEDTSSGISGLFRYATNADLLVISIGLIFAIIHGASFPILALVFGQMTNTFMRQSNLGFRITLAANETFADVAEGNTTRNGTEESELPLTPEEFKAYMTQFSFYYLYIGIGVLFASFVQTYCWELSCCRQVNRLRKIFFGQILRQDISWYDQNQQGNLSTKLSDDLERVQEGIGAKFSMVIQYVSTFVSGISVGLYANWRLTLVILGISPFLIGTSAFMARVASSSSSREQLKYSIAGRIAEQVLYYIKTVAAFGGEMVEIKRYEKALDEGKALALKKYLVLAIGLFLVFFVMYSSYGLAFWYGAQLIADGISTPGSVFTVFFSVMAGAFSIGNALPYVNAVSTAIGAASTIFGIIDRVPPIDPYSKKGKVLSTIKGSICFSNIFFKYPTRPEVSVLNGLTIEIESGKKIALVGSSGAGKSTIIQLLMRFYDPLNGQILVDGEDIKELNLSWLRSNFGIVSQEPVLFGVSIFDNIRYGKDNVSMEEVIQAATLANAHSFISELPNGYETMVGERGAQLSGGQKQRIAIARAIVRDPKILLLDEATSALDTESEKVVQEALDAASTGRTTIIVAHRLSTIKNVDCIYALKDGKVLEYGTHEELMKNQGLYHSLVTMQAMEADDGDLNEDDEGIAQDQMNKTSSIQSLNHSNFYGHKNDDSINTKEQKITMRYLIRINSPEWKWLTVGLIACCFTGAIMPVYAYFYGEIFSTFTLKGDALKTAALFWTGMFVLLGVVSGASFYTQIICMVVATENLVARLRLQALGNVIRQPISWFDFTENSAGKIITRLSRDAPLIKGAGGLRAAQTCSSFVTLVAAVVISAISGWKLALAISIGVPLIIIASWYQMSLVRRNQIRDTSLMDEAGRVATECIQNLTTVQGLGKENMFLNMYMEYLKLPFRESKKQAFTYALYFAIAQTIIYLMYSGAFRFGAYLIEIGDMTPGQVYRVFFALAFCATSVGQNAAYLQDFTKAKHAAGIIFKLIQRRSEIDPLSQYGVKPTTKGQIEFENVHFSYPTRSTVPVLRGINLVIPSGKTVALVGKSGCGKSTILGLLERFYEPTAGQILLDRMDIRTINPGYLRGQMGLVTQEPILFDATIKENIAYGYIALGSEPTEQQIIQAAKIANIHDFVVSLPLGYDTPCGDKGTQLSGGQKQRIAIARALVRDPKILLLDEATSALDSESEKVVQDALDKARHGRTTLIIAHRLSTIQSADIIAVIHRGKIIEIGTHEELKALHGEYYQLVKNQQL